MLSSTQYICLIIPCYNEELRLNTNLFIDFLEQHKNIFYVFVNDGSKDKTLQILNDLALKNNHIHVINLHQNQGKAEATRQAMLWAAKQDKFDYIGYFDADLATPLKEVFNLLNEFNQNKKLLISFGSRQLTEKNNIKRKYMRHILGRLVANTISFLFKLNIHDTQCGAKLFKTSIVNTLFNDTFFSTWIFDVEIFVRLKVFILKQYQQKNINLFIKETPVQEWTDIAESKVPTTYFFRLLKELFKIKKNYHIK